MQQGSQSGDGKTSPFGDGKGGSVGGSMAGNDFGANPGGTRTAAKLSGDLINNSRAQSKAKPDHNTQDAAPGGLIPQAAPPATRPGGVGSLGNGAKPYKLGA
jgi:hypothetical protein